MKGDISEKEFKESVKPFFDIMELYIHDYIIPEFVSYYLADAYDRNRLEDCSFIRHFNSAIDCLCISIHSNKYLEQVIIKRLKTQYNLNVISLDPLLLEKSI